MTDAVSARSPARPRVAALSIPNLLTIGRMAAVPGVAACLFVADGPLWHWLATVLFVAACITDFLDGYFARLWSQQSALGRMLDPIADKLLVGAVLLMLVFDRTIDGWSIWAALIILSREIVVSGLREFLAEINVKLRVTWLAKWKTTIQMIALGVLLLAPAIVASAPWAPAAGIGLLWMAALLTIFTGLEYLRAAVSTAMRH
ncbi:MAG: CDP-diacylglycerol--glycerol-3-phosphate 3-phosphatidyltransferase [Hyphomicrobiaceae bacterium]